MAVDDVRTTRAHRMGGHSGGMTTIELQPLTLRTAFKFVGNLIYAVIAVVLFGRSDSGETKSRSRTSER